MTNALARAALALALASGSAFAAEPATFSSRALTPETALKAAQAALAKCRADGFQVSVAVVDRSGLEQVMLRDRFAGAHTPEAAANKAWTAVSFRAFEESPWATEWDNRGKPYGGKPCVKVAESGEICTIAGYPV